MKPPPLNVWPRVVPAGETAPVRVSAGDAAARPWRPGHAYVLRCFSLVNRAHDARQTVVADAEGALTAALAFEAPGEYTLAVSDPDDPGAEAPAARLFCTRASLARLRPFKGDMHLHTDASDGKDSAADMAAAARRQGMDVAAFTDHDRRLPDADRAVLEAGLEGGLLVLAGEEVTIRAGGGHLLALGAAGAVEAPRRDTDDNAARRPLAARLASRALEPPLTAETYSRAAWAVEEIRRQGGYAILAHPYWVGTTGKYYPPRCMVDQLLADGLVDGIELMSGSADTEGNLLCAARYREAALGGVALPIVGGSDAHETADVGRVYTVLFAETLDAASVREAVLQRRAVACDVRMGNTPAVFGPFAFVEYAGYLLREYFPGHDRLCARQADAGSPSAARCRAARKLEELRARFWHPSS